MVVITDVDANLVLGPIEWNSSNIGVILSQHGVKNISLPEHFHGVPITIGSLRILPVVDPGCQYNQRLQTQTSSVECTSTEATVNYLLIDRDLATVQQELIDELHRVTEHDCLRQVPLWKQINALVPGRMSTEEVRHVLATVEAHRGAYQTEKTRILAATSLNEL